MRTVLIEFFRVLVLVLDYIGTAPFVIFALSLCFWYPSLYAFLFGITYFIFSITLGGIVLCRAELNNLADVTSSFLLNTRNFSLTLCDPSHPLLQSLVLSAQRSGYAESLRRRAKRIDRETVLKFLSIDNEDNSNRHEIHVFVVKPLPDRPLPNFKSYASSRGVSFIFILDEPDSIMNSANQRFSLYHEFAHTEYVSVVPLHTRNLLQIEYALFFPLTFLTFGIVPSLPLLTAASIALILKTSTDTAAREIAADNLAIRRMFQKTHDIAEIKKVVDGFKVRSNVAKGTDQESEMKSRQNALEHAYARASEYGYIPAVNEIQTLYGLLLLPAIIMTGWLCDPPTAASTIMVFGYLLFAVFIFSYFSSLYDRILILFKTLVRRTVTS